MNYFHIVKMCEFRAKDGNTPSGKQILSVEFELTLFKQIRFAILPSFRKKDELQARKIKL